MTPGGEEPPGVLLTANAESFGESVFEMRSPRVASIRRTFFEEDKAWGQPSPPPETSSSEDRGGLEEALDWAEELVSREERRLLLRGEIDSDGSARITRVVTGPAGEED